MTKLGFTPGSHLLFLDPAFVVLLDPHAARLLAIGLILCVPYPGKGGSGEGGCNGQGNQRQQKSLHGVLLTENSGHKITGYLLVSSLPSADSYPLAFCLTALQLGDVARHSS